MLLLFPAGAALLAPGRAHGQFTGTISATTQYESNSNLFAVDTGVSQAGAQNTPTRAEDISYGAAFATQYAFGRQQLYASGRFDQYDYQQELSDLNHNEYNFDTGLRWKLAEVVDGNLDASRTHTMVPFLDLSGSKTLSVQTTQQEKFQIGVTPDSDWRLEGVAITARTSQPGVGLAPGLNLPPASVGSDQQLSQNSGTISIAYTGIGPLASGLTVGYMTGDNGNIDGAAESTYRQGTAGFFASYKLTRTKFDGQVGYTHRTSNNGGGTESGLTGLIDFSDQLTAKTSFTVKLERAIQILYLNLGSETDTDAGISVAWQATYKTAVSLGYTFTYRAFPGEATGASGTYPVDYEQSANIAISYLPLRWLSIRPYANLLSRRSNTYGRNFDSNVYGITLAASIGNGTANR